MPSAGGWSQYHANRLVCTVARGTGRVAELDREVHPHGRQVLGDRSARLERHVELPGLQRLERAAPVLGSHPRAAAALHPTVPGVRTDQRDAPRLGGQRQQPVVVLEQHHALDGGLPNDVTGRRIVDGHLARFRVSGASPLGQREDAGHGPAEIDVADLAALCTSSSRRGPRCRGGPGISRSSPARSDSPAL